MMRHYGDGVWICFVDTFVEYLAPVFICLVLHLELGSFGDRCTLTFSTSLAFDLEFS